MLGGAEKSVQFLAEGLKDRGIETVVVTTAEQDKVGHINGVKVYRLKIPNLYWMYRAKTQPAYKKPFWHLVDSYNPFIKSRLEKVFIQEKPDIVHTNILAGISVYIWRAARKFGIPIAHTSRDYYLLCPRSAMFKNNLNCDKQCWACKLYSIPKRRLSENVDAYVGVSRYIMNKHLRFGYFKQARVKTFIYNPAGNFKSPSPNKKNGQHVTFGFIGGLYPQKGAEFLLDSFSRLNLKNARLKIFGRAATPDYEKYLIDRYSSKNIIFMGHCKPDEIYPSIDVSIIPSLWHEPFPRILLESYAHGVPVIAADRGGTPEMIKEDVTGFVFNPEKRGDLEGKMIAFVENPRLVNRLASNCADITKEFETEKTLNKYIDVYNKIIK